jgi:DNA-binding MarR family transcriptional regulator
MNETTANLLGALSLVLADDIREAADTILGHTGETAAALVTIGSNPDITTTKLAEALGLSTPATSRVVERLWQMGLVARFPCADDRRAMSLHLPPRGQQMRRHILAMRRAVVAEAVQILSDDEQAALDGILRKMLLKLTHSETRAYNFCRLCHEEICVPMGCPVETRCLEHEGLATAQ